MASWQPGPAGLALTEATALVDEERDKQWAEPDGRPFRRQD